jgi:O-antigen/teichoic acid export membrane protein
MPATPLTHRAAGAAWWSALEISARYGAQFIVMIILARLLTPADFGLIAMLLVFTSIGALLVDSGFSTALIQRQNTNADDETTVFLLSTGASVFVAVILWLAAPAIADFYSQPELIPLTRLLLFVLPLGALASVPDALLTKKLDFKARAKAETFASLFSGVVAVILAWRGFGVWSLAWQGIVLISVRALLLWWYSGWRPRGRFHSASFRNLFGFGSYMLMSSLLDTISVRLQSLLIGKLFDSRTLGYYTLAQNTQQAPTSFMGSLLNRVGLPVFSTVADQPAKLLGALRLSLRAAMFLFVPCMLGIAVVAKPLMGLLYGARWESAAPILSILAVSAALWPLHVLNLAALSAQGRSDLFFRLELVKKIIAISLILAVSPFGPKAIAAAVLLASLFGVIINTWYSKRLLGYGLLAQLSDQRNTFALALTAALAGWTILHWNNPGMLPTLAAIGAAVVVYISGAILFRSAALAELVSIGRSLIEAREAQKVNPEP